MGSFFCFRLFAVAGAALIGFIFPVPLRDQQMPNKASIQTLLDYWGEPVQSTADDNSRRLADHRQNDTPADILAGSVGHLLAASQPALRPWDMPTDVYSSTDVNSNMEHVHIETTTESDPTAISKIFPNRLQDSMGVQPAFGTSTHAATGNSRSGTEDTDCDGSCIALVVFVCVSLIMGPVLLLGWLRWPHIKRRGQLIRHTRLNEDFPALFVCHQNPEVCLLGWLCPALQAAETSYAIGLWDYWFASVMYTSLVIVKVLFLIIPVYAGFYSPLHWCLCVAAYLFPSVSLYQRIWLREREGMRQQYCSDCLLIFCCCCCASLVQEGIFVSNCFDAQARGPLVGPSVLVENNSDDEGAGEMMSEGL